jgi:hypothetical protein
VFGNATLQARSVGILLAEKALLKPPYLKRYSYLSKSSIFMKLQNIFLLFLSVLVVSCASTRPKELTNYENQLIAPEVIDEYALKQKKVFDEPSLGVMLRYENRDYPEDNITVYVYPISAISWENQEAVLESELSNAVNDIDAAVKYGYYKSRTAELLSDYSFESKDKEYKGKKAELTLTAKNGALLYSGVYLFLAEDKYIKFRTSFDSRSVKSSMGDVVVKSLLPKLGIPSESMYMKNLRAAHEKKMQQNFMRLIQQALENKTE